MKNLTKILVLASLGFMLGCTGATSIANLTHQADQGIEAGNPDLGGKKLTVVPQGRKEIYVLQFQESTTVRVTEVLDGIYQSLFTDYASFDGDLLIGGQFEQKDPIQFFLDLNDLYQVLAVIFTVGPQEYPADFLEETGSPACNTGQGSTPNQLAEGICSRIVVCNETFACDSCVAEVLAAPGLGQRFGGPNNSTLDETGQAIDNGEITVDPANLQACLADIEIIPCPLVKNDFNDETVPNYNAVKGLIPSPSCDKGVLKSNGP